MITPIRLQLSRRKGFDLQALPQTTKGLPAHGVARPGPRGNPFVVGQHGSQAECVDLFTKMLAGLIALNKAPEPAAQKMSRQFIAENIECLKGKNLACWCRADVLLEVANASEAQP